MEKRVITIESQTLAIKAQRLLLSKKIRAKVIKLHPSQTMKGCTHGVEILASDVYAAKSILRAGGIGYSTVIQL